MNDLKPLIIGSTDLNKIDKATKCLEDTCRAFDLDCQLAIIELDHNDALRTGQIDCYALPLDQVPVDKADDIVIAGLSERGQVSLKITTTDAFMDASSVLRVKEHTRIGVTNSSLRDQITHSFPNYETVLFKDKKILRAALLANEVTAIADWDHSSIVGYHEFTISPKELLPKPGSGVMAYLALRSNFTARKTIQEIHESEVAFCTNVERKIQQFLKPHTEIAAHCAIDRMGNYHLDLFAKEKQGIFKKIKISQSTFIKLAENACTKLNYEVSAF